MTNNNTVLNVPQDGFVTVLWEKRKIQAKSNYNEK